MVSTGKGFENKFRLWHKDIDCITFKYPESKTKKAICDRVTIVKNAVFWFECKHTESKTSFAFSLIKDHQWRSMFDIEEKTGKAYFMIEDGDHNVYMIKPSILSNLGIKSVKFHQLEHFLVKKQDFHRNIYI